MTSDDNREEGVTNGLKSDYIIVEQPLLFITMFQ